MSNTAGAFGGQSLSKSLAQITSKPKTKERTADEIISSISDKLRKIGEE